VAYMSLTKEMYEAEGVNSVATDEFIKFPRSIRGVEISVFFKENTGADNKVNVSFRSSGRIDVDVVASYFGGGGHASASGCVLNCSLADARNRVLAEVRKALHRG